MAVGGGKRSLIMNLDYVPLLRVMRELRDIPGRQPPDFNGRRRFRQYLRTIFTEEYLAAKAK